MAQPPRLAGYTGYQHFIVTFPADFVAHVEISRPEKLNAFFEAMWLELRQVFQQLSSDADVRAVVLSGGGDRAFTAGLDVKAANEGGMLSAEGADSARKAAKLRRYIAEFQDCISAVERCEKRRQLSVPWRWQHDHIGMELTILSVQPSSALCTASRSA